MTGQCGLADLLPSLETVYVGLSAGSMVGYAIDDQTAIKVIDGAIEVVSEGHWRRFAP